MPALLSRRRADVAATAGVGVARCHAHHGELLQGAVRGAHGTIPALVTLPCPLFASTAAFVPTAESVVRVMPGDVDSHAKALAAAVSTARYLKADECGGLLSIRSSIPRGRGLGSSTADVLAAARAVADAAGVALAPEALAEIAVEAEGAADALMWNRPVLFAQLHGRLLVDYGRPLPRFRVVGVDLAADGPGVDTDTVVRPRYRDAELDTFAALAATLGRALDTGDAALLGHVATASARIDLRYRPRREVGRIVCEHDRFGALGVQVAHSGTVLGVLVAPAAANRPDPVHEVAAWLEDRCQAPTWTFEVGGHAE